jgi:predicted outer membrane repeat protein
MLLKSTTKSKVWMLILALWMVTSVSRTRAAPADGTWFVSPVGSGTACTQSNPCGLGTAIANAADYQKVILQGGTYEGFTMLYIQRPLIVTGGWIGNASGEPVYDPENFRTVIQPPAPWISQIAVIDLPESELDWAMLRDMTLTGGMAQVHNSDTGSGGCVEVEHGRLYLIRMKIEHCEAENYGGGVYIPSHPDNNQYLHILDSTFTNNTATHGGGAIQAGWNVQGRIRASTFYDNHASYGSAISLDRSEIEITRSTFSYHETNTIMLSGNSNYELDFTNNLIVDSADTAIIVYGYDPVRMYHNTFYGNDSTVLQTAFDTAYVSFKNNIVAFSGDNGDILEKYDDSQIIANTNIFWQNGNQSLVGTGPIYEDPELNGEYHLTFYSPAIDAGLTTLDVEKDYDYDDRDTRPDIGADEFLMERIYLPTVLR